ncbi:PIG-L deacetylase family protein [Methanolobus sp. WCC5]|uniref:PIG-L deacetylase family protein n=1 Tax=Methanolobus sp. WCC5 TaxID=3125785 RepID=UPI003252240B
MKNLDNYNQILAIGAHPDDIEVGCGGFIAKCIHHGISVTTAIMSKCDNTISVSERGLREKEYFESTSFLKATNSYIYDIPDKEFPENRTKIMDILANLQAEIKPDLILIPFLNDTHQDHSTVAHCAIRTFRKKESILQYEILRHGSNTFTPSLFVDISDFIEIKAKALELYKTQIMYKAYFDVETYKALAKTRGAQSGCDYAEGFTVYKMYW